MRVIKRFSKATRHIIARHPVQQITQIKIVQNHHAWVPLDQSEHVFVQ